jgi:hypothetical protein
MRRCLLLAFTNRQESQQPREGSQLHRKLASHCFPVTTKPPFVYQVMHSPPACSMQLASTRGHRAGATNTTARVVSGGVSLEIPQSHDMPDPTMQDKG